MQHQFRKNLKYNQKNNDKLETKERKIIYWPCGNFFNT